MDPTQVFNQKLNPAQLEAVQTLHGPMLILAGAGSGKTRVLTFRTANIIAQGEATPEQILAVTFTNKAAREMNARITGLLDDLGVPLYMPMWIGTFHSTCARILRDNIHHLGYQSYFVIYDDSDQLSLIKKVLAQLDINEKVYAPKGFKARINEAKALGLSPDEVEKQAPYLMDERNVLVYRTYEEEMKKSNALDFADLLLKTYELFKNFPQVLADYQERFKFIMVDEYQDTNRIQYLLVLQLAHAHRNLCVVGDEDQSIYSWRGADISNILDFEKDFEDCTTVKLEENYRSSNNIVSAASALIQYNTERKDKTLFTNRPDGNKITVREEKTDYDEARYVVQKIQSLMAEGTYTPEDFAIFYRTNAQSRVLEDQLRSSGMSYRLVGAVKFYDRKEIKDILSYMKLILNPSDGVALKRAINTPARGIGKTTIEKIEFASVEMNQTMYDACLTVAEQRRVHSGAAKKLVAFRNFMDQMRSEAERLSPSEIYHMILDRTEYATRLKMENTPEAQARIDNLEEFDNAIVQFEKERGDEATLQGFLEEMALVSDADLMEDDDRCVTLMTLHISKGLEFPNVFIVGMEEGLFPSGRSIDDQDPSALQEERRLAYVGMTRAMENLFLVYARMRRVWGQEQQHPPSQFISEIPQEYLKVESAMQGPKFLDRYRKLYAADEETYGPGYNPESGPSFGSNGNGQRQRSSIRRRPNSPRNTGGFGKKKQANFSPDFDQMPDYENFSNENNGTEYKKGMRVRHPVFGIGSIYQVEGSGEDQKISIMFNDRTTKKFVAKHARLEKLA